MYGRVLWCIIAVFAVLCVPVVAHGQVACPSVVGLDQVSAEGEILAEGLTVQVNRVYSAEVQPGVVIDQVPPGGAMILPGGLVALTVSQGFDPQIYTLQGLVYCLFGVASGLSFVAGMRVGVA